MSRYYEYDYDRNCIIGFGSDMHDTDDYYHPSATSSESGDSVPNSSIYSISPYPSPSSTYSDLKNIKENCCDMQELDEEYSIILEADAKNIDTSKLKPLQIYEPFLLVSDMIKLKKKKLNLTFGDEFDNHNADRNIFIDKGLKQNIHCKSLQRLDDYNGNYYNAFGKYVINDKQCHVWKFQILGNSPAIVGVIEADASLEQSGAYFGCNSDRLAYSFNTITAKTYNKAQQPIYQEMLSCGILDKPMIIDMKLNLCNGTLTIANQTNGSPHFGKEILLFDNINKNKSYKLAIAFLGSETINLF